MSRFAVGISCGCWRIAQYSHIRGVLRGLCNGVLQAEKYSCKSIEQGCRYIVLLSCLYAVRQRALHDQGAMQTVVFCVMYLFCCVFSMYQYSLYV